jgi:hypothetical protein
MPKKCRSTASPRQAFLLASRVHSLLRPVMLVATSIDVMLTMHANEHLHVAASVDNIFFAGRVRAPMNRQLHEQLARNARHCVPARSCPLAGIANEDLPLR